MLNKKINLLLVLAVFLNGCIFKKKDRSARSAELGRSKNGEFVQAGGTYVFSDDADEFRLEDEGNDPFSNGQDYLGDQDDFQWDNIVYDNDAGEVIQFDFDDTAIKPSEKSKISHNAELAKQELNSNPKSTVAVKGHSCKIAKSELYNHAVSQERAEHVAQEYTKKGVPREKISPVGYGATELLTDEDGRDAQSVNRRVETDFVVV